ncbi:MAG TPA: DinB family protein [Propionicimonas sp.]|uniref:DinB family protein n=1 Tax=Propionicimonas sp. TaxID=1955623 RepID=UPI002F410700
MDRASVRAELEQARLTFHSLLDRATVADLRRTSVGTLWTNGELLFHMYFGYFIVVRLRLLVLALGRLPNPVSRAFSAVLEAATTPFHHVNYLTTVIGARVIGPARLGDAFDRVIGRLASRLDTDSDADLGRGMYYPPSWDPYFKPYMTVADLYRYPTQHFEHHRRQLTLDR